MPSSRKLPPVRAGDACRHALTPHWLRSWPFGAARNSGAAGLPPSCTPPGIQHTYGALTFGVTWKPALPAPVTGLLIRPEVRWDHAFTNNHPFNAQTSNNAVTLGIDAVLTF